MSGRHQSVGNLIGTDDVAAKFAHHGGYGALATTDPAGQANAEHHWLEAGWLEAGRLETGRAAVTPAGWARLSRAALIVLLMSMAMVSGPTPPGTGVMAPAICMTSG
jgi:hypothetical protein